MKGVFSMDLTTAIALRMKQLARERYSTLTEISKRANINQSTISEIIQGRSKHPRVSTIQKFCKGCGINLSEFFDSPLFDALTYEESKNALNNPKTPTVEDLEKKYEDYDFNNLLEFAAKMSKKKD